MTTDLGMIFDWDGGFSFLGLLELLVWVVWVVLNLWIWQKTKAIGNLLMLIGAAGAGFVQLMLFFNEFVGNGIWLVSLAVLSAGFFLSVRPMVEAHLAKLRAKLHNVTSPKKDGPPPAT
jgi:hypothetical protein